MLFIKKLSLFSLLVLSFLFNSSSVFAQENSKATDTLVYEQESFSKDIRQLKIQYRGELEEYRNLENLYIIAKNQYFKLSTLASLEDAVQKTQEAMVSRDKVLRTYLRLLRLRLLSQPGIELPAKDEAEQSLLSAIKSIEERRGQLDESLDKIQVGEVSVEFELLIDQIENAAYQTLTAISIGKLQTIHDQAIALEADMESSIATAGGVLKSTERRRSFDETTRVLEGMKQEFDLVEEKYSKPDRSGYLGTYQAVKKQLNSIHSSMAKALAFLGELLKI